VIVNLGLGSAGCGVGPGCSDRRPSEADRGRTWGRAVDRASTTRLRLGLAPWRMARPLGLLAMGPVLPELVATALADLL
jgi:hypothetical protein